MDKFRQYLISEGYEQLSLATRLTDEDSKNDPEDEPYKSKYKARDILVKIKEKMKHFLEDEAKCEESRLFAAVIDLKLGVNYIETEETHLGDEALNRCMDELEKYKSTKKACNIYQTALNQCGILSCAHGNYPKALSLLEKAESLYHSYKADVGGTPWSVDEFIKQSNEKPELIEHQRELDFENTYTLTLYYMAQIFAKTDESEKAAKYCQVTLQRQLDYSQYEPIEWALNAATLSQYYITAEDFPMARHCLASATWMFRQEAEKLSDSGNNLEETLSQRKSDIERCWIKYGLLLMEYSRDKLYKEVEDMDLKDKSDMTKAVPSTENSQCTKDEMKEMTSLRFNLELTSIEEQISCEQVNVFSEAREVFLSVQKWINSAKEFYSLENHCSDYVEMVQDHSRAFKLLAFYEMNLDRQCKMHKRRIDMLAALLKELNPQHYLLVCRQLMYENAETYSTMLDLKLAIVESDGGNPTPHAVNKMNSLAQQSIDQYETYLTSLKGGKPDLPEKFDDMDARPALVAKFCMGRLYSKLLAPSLSQRLENMQKSIDCYKFLVDYCKHNPDAKEIIKNEVDICAEMVELLPLKMAQARLNAPDEL